MQASLNRRLSSLERHYGPAMARPAMIGEFTSKEFVSLLTPSEREELREVMLSLIDGPSEESLHRLDKLYTIAMARKDSGLNY